MSIGKIAEFKVHSDDWRLYVERLEQYFLVNKIPDELQVPTLITVMGAECYELLVNLCTPVKPKSKTLAQIVDVMEKHLQPKPSELAERYKFRHRKQKEGETISEYAAILKKMSKTCDFGSWLEESLRDQLVCGITNESIRQRLFAESNLDFGKAYKIAVSMEAAEKDAAAVEGQSGLRSEGASTTSVTCQAMSAGSRRKGTAAVATRDVRGATTPFNTTTSSGWGRGARALAAAAPMKLGERAQQQQCRVCGARHDASKCKFGRYVCRVCNQVGHLRRMCPNLSEHYNVDIDTLQIKYSKESDGAESDEVIVVDVCKLSATQCSPIYVELNVNGIDIKMECDTGSAVSCISWECYRRLFNDVKLKPSNLILKYYTGELVKPLGVIQPVVKYKNGHKQLDLYVVENGKTLLLGRQWMAELKIQLPTVTYDCNSNDVVMYKNNVFDVAAFSTKYCEVFADGLGRFTGGTVSVCVREGARPVFMRARPLAYALREPVERALDQLQRDGILSPVERSDWATPIVPVVKKDGNIRICADYKLTLNKVIEVDRYPLPKVEEVLLRLKGGQHFSKIDLSQAYAQFELDETKKYTVINTHKGLFMYNRLVYGLASSPGIFQRHLEQLFADLPHVGVFLDDIIITGPTNAAHMRNLCKVFDRLHKYGLKVKKDKCVFFAESVNYLGHSISKEGVHTCADKVEAIVKTPAPTNISELRAFIGMVMYYGKFIRNVSTILAPMYKLLKAGTPYSWNRECEDAFSKVKHLLTCSEVLMHYTPELPIILTTDASSVGVGAVISHTTARGERPVAYASRSLTQAERAYSQIDREALAIVFGVRKFHQYLYGRKFILRTDHKPLTYIFGDKVGIPVMAASRLQRWAVLLAGYTYDIEYVSSSKNCADALSRLPYKGCKENVALEKEKTYVNFVENYLPITSQDVRKATAVDKVLSRVFVYIQSGWPTTSEDAESIKPYFMRRNELYTEGGCIMWGYRMVIPNSLQSNVLKQLHSSHMGIVKTKSLARSYVWWPNIDAAVEALCKQCETCAAEADAPPRAPIQPWQYHARPWTRVHIDFLGPYKGLTFLVIVDSTSKWLEVFEMTRTNASNVIKVLRATFARFGLPEELVSDQGPPFTSIEFKTFLKNNGIKQFFSPAYHPSSNGAAENAVKLCKRAIKKAHRDCVDVDTALQTFLLAYRNTVHSTTGETPAMLLQRRPLRSRLDLLRTDQVTKDRVHQAQRRQREFAGGTDRSFREGDSVWAREYGVSDRWVKGTVERVDSARRYSVAKDNGQSLKRHVDQMRRRSRLSDVTCPETEDSTDHGGESVVEPLSEVLERVVKVASPEATTRDKGASPNSDNKTPEDDLVNLIPQSPLPENRYSKRTRKPVDRFKIV